VWVSFGGCLRKLEDSPRITESRGENHACGAGGPLEIQAVDLAVGPGGNIYTWGIDGRYEHNHRVVRADKVYAAESIIPISE
jgi:hypothetical protein